MTVLLHPTYFPNIAHFAVIAQNEICWEQEDNYQKQTFRNRTYICTDQGKHMLNIPIQHVGGAQGRQKFKDVKLENAYHWQRQHWRTLETAYRTSPFFEFYEDELAPLFEKKHSFLLDFNLQAIEIVCGFLEISMPTLKTESYESNPKNILDARHLANAKQDLDIQPAPYTQVFGKKHNFIGNMSILDLLFNEGTNALDYLENQPLDFLNG